MRKNRNFKKFNIVLAALTSAVTVAGACAPAFAETTGASEESDKLSIAVSYTRLTLPTRALV